MRFVAGFVLGTLLLLAGMLAYLEMGFADVAADAAPSHWTKRFLYTSTHAAVRRHAPKQQNPLPHEENVIIAGGKLYLNDCVGCHGEFGKPPSEFGATFYPPAPQLWTNQPQYTDAEIFWIAKHGVRRTGMSAQGPSYSDTDLWRLATFIQHMTHLTPPELAAIQQPTPQPAAEK